MKLREQSRNNWGKYLTICSRPRWSCASAACGLTLEVSRVQLLLRFWFCANHVTCIINRSLPSGPVKCTLLWLVTLGFLWRNFYLVSPPPAPILAQDFSSWEFPRWGPRCLCYVNEVTGGSLEGMGAPCQGKQVFRGLELSTPPPDFWGEEGWFNHQWPLI